MDDQPSLVFEALADPTRREILRLLSEREMAATDVANAITWIGRTAVSSHLRILRTASLVSERRDGKFRYYSTNPGAAAGVMEFLSEVYRTALDSVEIDASSRAADARGPRTADAG
ncbi:MAG: metalloregulator ArsR/SmtB family transcription factor [Aeromicrobium sp.]